MTLNDTFRLPTSLGKFRNLWTAQSVVNIQIFKYIWEYSLKIIFIFVFAVKTITINIHIHSRLGIWILYIFVFVQDKK